MELRIKLLPTSLQILGDPLPIHLTAIMSLKATEDVQSAWTSANYTGDPGEAVGLWIQPGPSPGHCSYLSSESVHEINQSISVCVCVCVPVCVRVFISFSVPLFLIFKN